MCAILRSRRKDQDYQGSLNSSWPQHVDSPGLFRRLLENMRSLVTDGAISQHQCHYHDDKHQRQLLYEVRSEFCQQEVRLTRGDLKRVRISED